MTRRVLVVEDEVKLRNVLTAYVRAAGFEAVEARTGRDALNAVRLGVDLVLLDVGLPDLDGLDVLARLRGWSTVPVILVTARAEEEDRIRGLSVGADDYVTKPFSPREVVARVEAVLRRVRPAEETPSVLHFDGLTVDVAGRTARTDAGRCELTPLDFDLLAVLASEPGRAFSREELLERVWGYRYLGDPRVVDVHVRSLRQGLGDDASTPRIVGTVRGIGYKLLLEPVDVT